MSKEARLSRELRVAQDLADPKTVTMDYPGKSTVYIPANRMGHWGDKDMRTRCAQCGKVWFGTEDDANRSAAKVTARGRTRMKSYLGQCGHWHTARVK